MLILLFATYIAPLDDAKAATTIDGYPVFCVALNGVPVTEVAQPGLGDVARATMAPSPYGPVPVILFEPGAMMSFGPDTQARLFVYAHECAHHALGHILRGLTAFSEVQADCWGIKVGRDQGWFDIPALQRLALYFANNPGDQWGHLPGPQRIANFQRCFLDPTNAKAYAGAIVSGQLQY